MVDHRSYRHSLSSLIFFLVFISFPLSSLHSGISRATIFPQTRLHGGSAVCHTECISFVFPDCISPSTLHINVLELFTIIVVLKHWAPQLQSHKFIVSFDNSAAVAVINSTTLKDPFMQRCLRQVSFTTALFDFEVHAQFAPGKHNQFVHYLSRWHSDPLAHDSFHCLCRDSDQTFRFQDVDTACFSFDVA